MTATTFDLSGYGLVAIVVAIVAMVLVALVVARLVSRDPSIRATRVGVFVERERLPAGPPHPDAAGGPQGEPGDPVADEPTQAWQWPHGPQ